MLQEEDDYFLSSKPFLKLGFMRVREESSPRCPHTEQVEFKRMNCSINVLFGQALSQHRHLSFLTIMESSGLEETFRTP